MTNTPLLSDPDGLTRLIKLTTVEFIKLRELVLARDGNLDKFREWQKGKRIIISYPGDHGAYFVNRKPQEQTFN